jgi:tyrosyl-tRNA synthetase
MSALTNITASKGEARRSIEAQAVSVNKTKIEGIDVHLTSDQLINGRYLLLENGKKNKYLLTTTA